MTEGGMQAGSDAATASEVLVKVRDLKKYFPVQSTSAFRRSHEQVHAVDGVDLEVFRGETLGLVGETGCGKSTLARCIARLLDLSEGQVEFDGRDITDLSARQMRPLRREMQIIFQDPYGSLNPRRRVGSIIGDPFALHGIADGAERKRRVQEVMELVGLKPEHFNRFPAEFSGGQRQRIGVARALALKPKLIICDEPVSALDVSIQAQIINLLGRPAARVQPDLHLHRPRPVGGPPRERQGGGDVPGQDRRTGPGGGRLPGAPPSLLQCSAVGGADAGSQQKVDSHQIILSGDVPSPINPPSGCRFHPRCPKAQEKCCDRRAGAGPGTGRPARARHRLPLPVETGEVMQSRPGRGYRRWSAWLVNDRRASCP